jgi:hypothetical protein
LDAVALLQQAHQPTLAMAEMEHLEEIRCPKAIATPDILPRAILVERRLTCQGGLPGRHLESTSSAGCELEEARHRIDLARQALLEVIVSTDQEDSIGWLEYKLRRLVC